MISLEIKNCNTILTEKQQIYQHYLLEKLLNMNILQMKKILPSNQRKIIEQAKFAYPLLGKAFGKQKEKQVGAIKSLDLANKLKRIESIFP